MTENPTGATPPPRVLIVEDDRAAANLLTTLLSRVGYDVSVAYTGVEALERLEEATQPDVLLLDWMLPEVSGLELCQRVRRRWDATRLPILMVTAKTDAESIQSAFEAGASDYITKPFLAAELRARVASHLHLKRLIEERHRMDEHLMEREKLSSLGLLVGGVAHDLNNPLAAIYGYAQMLLEDETDTERSEGLRQIVADVQRSRRIIRDLLDFARHHPPQRETVSVPLLLESTLALRQRQLEAAGVRVRVSIDPDLPRLRANGNQLQQVFLNILLNAEQALRGRGSELHVTAEPVGGGAGDMREGWASVRFFNDGPPIPEEALARVFDPFFTTKGREEGTGLGLAISRRIIRDHGGDIEVETGPGGTTFAVFLPPEESA